MTQDSTQAEWIEEAVRRRIRSLRLARGWSLDALAARTHLGASTISRIETGHRRLAVDHLVALALALDTSIDELIAGDDGREVVIRPVRADGDGLVYWQLNRSGDPSGRVVAKLRIPASRGRPDPKVHPGRDWFTVLDGTARLVLGEREYRVAAGEAAEFDTMTPHWIAGWGGPVEILTIFDHHGQSAHLRPTSLGGSAAAPGRGAPRRVATGSPSPSSTRGSARSGMPR